MEQPTDGPRNGWTKKWMDQPTYRQPLMEMSRMYLKIDGLRKDVKKDLTSSIPVKVNQKSI